KALESDFNNFIYITSHDLKAPLRGIIALASWIHDDYRSILDDQGRAHLILLIDRVQKLSNMFDGILALSRISNNNNTIEPVNIDSIINSILENCDIKINLDINEELPTILTDKAKLKSIFEILIYNSVTHSQNALNDISIGYNQEKSYFYLNDNGIGIEEKYHDKVFDIFFKVKSDEKTRIGVGLAIAKKIVNSLNGSISINKDYTKGVEFIFTLPKIN
ncbi:MAG: ATP-binding protein, partial [Crocinitomicaceae bacterium]